MAGSGTNDFCGNWLGGWLQTAKEKSTAALDMVRKDLAEFGCTMHKDTSHAVEVTSTTLKDSLKAENSTGGTKEKLTKGLNTFLEGISKAIAVPPDDEGQIPITASSLDLCHDRRKARLHALQVDPDTYLHEPNGSPEDYSTWCEGFNLDTAKGEISELLVSKAEVRGLYTNLVPSRVSHMDFWRHYFYRRHQMEVDRARKEDLMKWAERSKTEDPGVLRWEFDWSGDEASEDSSSDNWEPSLTGANSAMVSAPDTAHPPSVPSALAAQQRQEGCGVVATQTDTESPSHTAAHPVAAAASNSSSSQGVPQDLTVQAVSAAAAAAASEERNARGTFVDLHSGGDKPMTVVASVVEETMPSSTSKPSQSRRSGEEERSEEQGSSALLSDDSNEVGQTAELQGTRDLASALVSNLASPAGGSLPLGPDISGEQGLQTEPVVNATVEPVSSQVEPVSGQVEPVSGQVEPVSGQVEPVSGQVEPVSSQVEPVSGQVEQTSGIKAEPERDDTEPVTSPNELVTIPGHISSEATIGSVANQSQATVVSVDQPGQSMVVMQETQEAGQAKGSAPGDQRKATELTSDPGNVASTTPPAKSDSASALEEEDEWDQDVDLDVELTEEDMKAAEQLAQALGDKITLEDDDWENWE